MFVYVFHSATCQPSALRRLGVPRGPKLEQVRSPSTVAAREGEEGHNKMEIQSHSYHEAQERSLAANHRGPLSLHVNATGTK